jgi:putative endonuclease
MKHKTGDAKGRFAEWRAALLLRLKGYRIHAQRFRSGQGEVDLIAGRGRALAFIEVKFRETEDAAAESVNARQRRRILNAANAFLARNPRLAEKDCRFDLILVTSSLLPRHVLNAWTASDDNGR